MAEGAAATVPEGDAPPKKGKGGKLMIIGAIVAALLAGGGGAYFMFGRKPPADTAKAVEKAPPKALQYAPLEMFTVNLRHADQERYLQVTINLEVADSATIDAIKVQTPSVRNRVLLLLSSQDADVLMTREGKEKLAADIATELRKTLDGAGPNKGLEQVLFSHFVIQ